MLRILAFLIVCAVSGGLVGRMDAQAEPTETAVVSQNPLLSQVAKANASALTSLVSKLRIIGDGARQGTARAPSPTDTERAQIRANPLFARAYEQDPEATLGVLRQVNIFLAGRASAQ